MRRLIATLFASAAILAQAQAQAPLAPPTQEPILNRGRLNPGAEFYEMLGISPRAPRSGRFSEEPSTPLRETMAQIGPLFRGIVEGLRDTASDGPERDARLATDAQRLFDLFAQAASQPPAAAAEEPALSDYRRRILAEAESCSKLKAALLAGRDEDARAIVSNMGLGATSGHRLYRPR